jgi:hypothetical protein
MPERTPEDRLREEYFSLVPGMRRVLEELEAKVRHCLLPLTATLDKYERLVVRSRIKDCESALGKLRKEQEGKVFDPEQAGSYSLTALNDLAAVRVLAFPRSRWIEADQAVRQLLSSWMPDPVPADDGGEDPLAFKYHGYTDASAEFRGEVQIVPMLIGLFWDVEHSAIYKPTREIKRIQSDMKGQKRAVLAALKSFDAEFERLVRADSHK